MNISPNFSGKFFFRTPDLAQLKINRPEGIQVDIAETPDNGYAIQVQPQDDEFVSKALQSDPDTELFVINGKTNDPIALQKWADTTHTDLVRNPMPPF